MKRTILILILLLAPVLLWAQEESLESLQQRAEAGDGAAMLRLSEVYSKGEFGVEPDNQTAYNYLVRATETGNPHAYLALAEHYREDSWGILEPDQEQSRLYLERAAEQNHLGAILLLSNHEKTYEGKLGIFLRMIEVTPLAGTEDLAGIAKQEIVLYLNKERTIEGDTYDPTAPNATRALAWLRSEAEAGDPLRQHQLGCIYWRSLNDKAKGRYWVLKAAEAGHVTAARVLGRLIYISEDSPYRDLQEALKWLVQAAEGGDAEAQFYLGSAYCPTIKNLYPVPQKDIWLAIQWFERAAAQGHIQAQEIGGFQTVGYAKHIRNKKESYAIGAHGIRLLEMGVEQGNAHCALLLGIAYGLGYGVKKDNKKCHYYYAIAARGGDQKAIEHCRKFNIPY